MALNARLIRKTYLPPVLVPFKLKKKAFWWQPQKVTNIIYFFLVVFQNCEQKQLQSLSLNFLNFINIAAAIQNMTMSQITMCRDMSL